MSKVLTGTVQGVTEKDRTFTLDGELLIDGVKQGTYIRGIFKLLTADNGNFYIGEFSLPWATAIFFISLDGEGVFITKKAEGPCDGLECGGIDAEFARLEVNGQGWTLTFRPIKRIDQVILFEWDKHADSEDGTLIRRETDKLYEVE